jgi:hypothetical protein
MHPDMVGGGYSPADSLNAWTPRCTPSKFSITVTSTMIMSASTVPDRQRTTEKCKAGHRDRLTDSLLARLVELLHIFPHLPFGDFDAFGSGAILHVHEQGMVEVEVELENKHGSC